MTFKTLDIVSGSYNDPVIDFSSQKTSNMYIIVEQQGKKQKRFTAMPGHALWVDVVASLSQPLRGMWQYKFDTAYIYCIIEQDLYRIDNVKAITKITTASITSSSGVVQSTASDKEAIYIDGSAGYTYNFGTGTFAQITATDFPDNPVLVGYLDDRIYVLNSDTNTFVPSALNDFRSWDSENTLAAQFKPGKLIAGTVFHTDIYLFKTEGTEIWVPITTPSPVPIRRDNSRLYDFGCAAKNSIAQNENYLLWLASNANGVSSIMLVEQGSYPQRISTQSLDQVIQSYGDVSDAEAFVFEYNSHTFYQINFPVPDKSYIFDVTTKGWFDLEQIDGTRHLANSHVYFANKHLVGLRNKAQIHEMSDTIYKYGDNTFNTKVRTKHIYQNGYQMQFVNGLKIDIASGNAPINGEGSDPYILCSFSHNGGRTFTSMQPRSAGKIGEYRLSASWFNLGSGRDFVLDIDIRDPYKRDILGASMDMEVADD